MSAELLAEARRLADAGDAAGCAAVLARVAADPGSTSAWAAADRLAARLPRSDDGTAPWARRTVRLALLASHTSGPMASALRVAALAHGVALDVHEAPYHAYEQEIADPTSGTYASRPDVVLLAVDQREARLAEVSGAPDDDVRREVQRWRAHWDLLRERSRALVLQTSFVPPAHDALGDVALRTPGARRRLLRRVNDELALAGDAGAVLVDAEAVAAQVGAAVWEEPRYWFAGKQAVGPGALPFLARRVADVLAGALGLGRKVVVLDLDNTLWGGVVGEDGVGGLVLGDGPAGEAFAAFQAYAASLRTRGLLLAVCSKNNPADARAPFEQHPEMRLRLDDLVAFEASWDTKPEALRRIAKQLDVGLDALVLVDDNPAEREIVRQLLPQVGVVELPAQPSGYVAAVASYPGLQSAGLTADDARRTEQYHARREAAELEGRAATREDFLASLRTTARVEPLDDVNLARVVQLVGKTNQLNLTGRRHQAADLLDLAARPGGLVWGLRVADRFDDHGLVGVVAAVPSGHDLRVDTFVLSCRVLGRTAERALLDALHARAAVDGRRRILGEFVATERNAPARPILAEAGFRPVEAPPGGDPAAEWWALDVAEQRVGSPYVAWTGPDGSAGGGEAGAPPPDEEDARG
ncbi:HAD-IIIC family phosphatase [Cellulosimicrobium marinum]|uniref:HAD-IIIC family phosphatase n=1 Tax=Cellulosimicrobium marinum TaxID=1638992 RepID=UPI001E48010A|nr:HAD-IIIC family phosphatase [Cellulosimicrobium marinum]MCB7137039.1 HAD-IIIC family phosphatase [Cellulosimicrobium marinum]